MGNNSVEGLNVHGEKKLRIREEVKVVESAECVVSVFDVSRQRLNNRQHEIVKIVRNEFSRTTTGRDNGTTRIIRLVNFRQEIDDNVDENLVDTKFGKCQVGSMLSYQVAFTESNFTATADISTVPRQQGVGCQEINFPRFPLRDDLDMHIPVYLTSVQKKRVR